MIQITTPTSRHAFVLDSFTSSFNIAWNSGYLLDVVFGFLPGSNQIKK